MSDFGFRVSGFGFRALGFGFLISGFGAALEGEAAEAVVGSLVRVAGVAHHPGLPTQEKNESLLNLQRRTVNLRRPERARNEGYTGPTGLDDTTHRVASAPCAYKHASIREVLSMGNTILRLFADASQ